MPAPSPLWSGDRDPGLRPPDHDAPTQQWLDAPERPGAPGAPAPRAAEPPRREPPAPRTPRGGDDTPSRRRGLIPGLVVGAVLAGGAFTLGSQLSDDGTTAQSGEVAEVATPLSIAKGGVDPTAAGQVYDKAGRSVVQVRRSGGSGTGFIVEGAGIVVTNAHVVGSTKDVKIILEDGEDPIDARVTGTDESSDLAVLKVDPAALKGRPALQLADSDDVQVGDPAIAIGYPLGLNRSSSVTSGIISGIGRQIEAPNGFSIDKVLQTDAPINPGNSGGPLLDARGRVVGVNSQIATAGGGGGNVGIGFAVPSNTVKEVVPTLSTGGKIERPYLGVSTAEPADGSDGAQIAEVRAGGPASAAGLQGPAFTGGTGGDVIVAIDGKRVTAPEDVAAAIAGKAPGDKIGVEVRRNGALEKLDVTLGDRPANAGP